MSKHLLKLTAIISYFHNNKKLLERGENAYTSGHVAKIDFDGTQLIINAVVKASMKDKSYKVKVT